MYSSSSTMQLNYHQSRAIDIAQKTVSSISVLGELLVIITFVLDNKFRKPLNRLVFYATWGNLLCNVATLIGQSAIRLGLGSHLCQFQGFIIQWLMPADVLWVFAMALNVWLTWFYRWDSSMLKSLEWKYVVFCYGCPLVSAIVLLCIKTQSKGRVYGDATIWCWISLKWDPLRVGIFYGPVWVVLLIIFAIYVRVGIDIWSWRRKIKAVEKNSRDRYTMNHQDNTTNAGITRTDEVTVTREDASFHRESRRKNSRPNLRPGNLRNRAVAAFAKRTTSSNSIPTTAAEKTNQAAMRYFKCALLFFIALVVVWIPSSVNRIYTLVKPDAMVFGLQFAAALVLPLQGFWNSFIYFATSMYAVRSLYWDIMKKCGRRQSASEAKAIQKSRKPGDMSSHEIEEEEEEEEDDEEEEIAHSDEDTAAESEAEADANTIAGEDDGSVKSMPLH